MAATGVAIEGVYFKNRKVYAPADVNATNGEPMGDASLTKTLPAATAAGAPAASRLRCFVRGKWLDLGLNQFTGSGLSAVENADPALWGNGQARTIAANGSAVAWPVKDFLGINLVPSGSNVDPYNWDKVIKPTITGPGSAQIVFATGGSDTYDNTAIGLVPPHIAYDNSRPNTFLGAEFYTQRLRDTYGHLPDDTVYEWNETPISVTRHYEVREINSPPIYTVTAVKGTFTFTKTAAAHNSVYAWTNNGNNRETGNFQISGVQDFEINVDVQADGGVDNTKSMLFRIG
jgi:hypothetical protein